jgi:hypothetical protein
MLGSTFASNSAGYTEAHDERVPASCHPEKLDESIASTVLLIKPHFHGFLHPVP